MIIDLSLSIVSMGATKKGADNSSIVWRLVKLLKEQNLNPMFNNSTDLVYIVKEGLYDHKTHFGVDYLFQCKITPQMGNLLDTYADAQVYFYSNTDQFTIRINLLPSMEVKNRTDYDDFAENVRDLAKKVHLEMGSIVTIVDKNRTSLGRSRYNLKTLPLWVGWFSIYSSDVISRYKLLDIKNSFTEVVVKHEGKNLILKSQKRWADYKKNGWSSDIKDYLVSIKGRLLFK